MALANLLKREDAVDRTETASSPSLALDALANVALDDTAPLVCPPTPGPPVPGDANVESVAGVALPVSLSAMDDRYLLPAPLRDRNVPAARAHVPLPMDPAVVEEVARAILDASGGEPATAATASVLEPPAAGIVLYRVLFVLLPVCRA